jgi:hypothetical protein
MKKCSYFILVTVLVFTSLGPKEASAFTPWLRFSYGSGNPDSLEGYRLALGGLRPFTKFSASPINLIGYWEPSFSNWYVNPPQIDQPKTIYIVAVSPVIRLQTREKYFLGGKPYVEFGIGGSLLSNNHLGHRNLGGHFAFQDLIGLGVHWGTTQAWSSSYHYLHYSNAGLLPPNQGIDVKHLISLTYEFN